MTTALTVANADQFSVLIPEQTQAVIDTVQGMGGFNGLMQYRIKLPTGGAKFFTVDTEEGEKALPVLEAVILCVIPNQRQWHAMSMEEGDGGQAPDCASVDGVQGYGRRSRDGEGFDRPATWQDCASCPHNQWGSSSKGGKGKSCKETAIMWIMRPDRGLPEAISVPPTSLKALKEYQVKLLGAKALPYQTLTKIGLELDKSERGVSYAKLSLARAGTVPEGIQAGAVLLAKAIREAMMARTPFINEPIGGGELEG